MLYQVSQEAIATSAEEVLHRLINMNDFNLSSVSQFAVNNMGTLTSVLEQVSRASAPGPPRLLCRTIMNDVTQI